MSYSSDTKRKLILSEIKSGCCAPAELSAAVLMNGGCIFISQDKSYIKRINALASKSGEIFAKDRLFALKDRKGACLWGVSLCRNQAGQEIIGFSKKCCAAAFIRGCFIRSGYISSPEKTARADISFKNSQALDLCSEALKMCGIHYNVSVRNGKDLIYIKGFENVSLFLARIGAVGAMLEIENSSIVKKSMSAANRVRNCDNANLEKTVSAGLRQKMLFSEFMKTAAFKELPEELQDIARMRVENESLQISDIGASLRPPISKSGAAHRLRKLENIAIKTLGQLSRD